MRKEFPLTEDEEEAFEALGGFEAYMEVVDRILREHGILRSLYSKAEREQIRRGRRPKGIIEFRYDAEKSIMAHFADLLEQAEDVQQDAGGTTSVGAMMLHLVGAKLDLTLGEGKIEHHGFSATDNAAMRYGHFQIENLVIYVTAYPIQALARKCAENLQSGLKPLIITMGDGLSDARFVLKELNLTERVDVLDVIQFLTANVYEHSAFQSAACKGTLTGILLRYNGIVSECETDPMLRVVMGKAR